LALRPYYPRGDEQFASDRGLEMAESVLSNLQKYYIDSYGTRQWKFLFFNSSDIAPFGKISPFWREKKVTR
jgi:hypothetical protein